MAIRLFAVSVLFLGACALPPTLYAKWDPYVSERYLPTVAAAKQVREGDLPQIAAAGGKRVGTASFTNGNFQQFAEWAARRGATHLLLGSTSLGTECTSRAGSFGSTNTNCYERTKDTWAAIRVPPDRFAELSPAVRPAPAGKAK